MIAREPSAELPPPSYRLIALNPLAVATLASRFVLDRLFGADERAESPMLTVAARSILIIPARRGDAD